MTELEALKAEIKMLEKKLSFLEELERTKSPVEEAYKKVYGNYPDTGIGTGFSYVYWDVFQKAYEQAQKDYKVGEFQETAQERGERVHNEMEEMISKFKGQSLYDLIADWSLDSVTDNIDLDVPTCVEDLLSRIEEWLPKEHDTNSYKWNQCIRMIKSKLR